MKDIREIPHMIRECGGQGSASAGREALYFILENHLFGHEAVTDNGTLTVPDEAFDDLYRRAAAFLSQAGKDISEKIHFLEGSLRQALPCTAQRLDTFFSSYDIMPRIRYRLLDWAVFALHGEAHLLTSGETEGLVRQMNLETSLEAVKVFCSFLEWMRTTYRDTCYSVTVIPPASRSRSTAGQAYGLSVMAALYYGLFCEEAIGQQNLVQRACERETSAHAWTYLSIHLVSALRDTDLAGLAHPALPDPPAEVLAKVKSGAYGDEVYTNAVHSTMRRFGYIHMAPNKTRCHQGVPELVLVIPQSLEPHFGRLFMLCEAHLQLSGRPLDSPLFKKVTDYYTLRACLGDTIGSIFRERNASPLALARSYLQCLEAAGASSSADKGLAAVHGYMLASMARSHKSGPGGFAETTAAYLKDFGLGIISPEQTAREMFDRGILSCLPSMLLDLITDGAYKSLDFSQQAGMLKGLGLSPIEVESLMELVLTARERSRAALKEALSACEPEERPEAVARALGRIAGYQAPGKQPDILCLMSAMGKTCQDPAATNCLLCPFRIDTRAAVYQAAGELHRLLRLSKQAVTAGEKKKYALLARQCLLPVIQLASDIIQQTYGPETSNALLALLRGIAASGRDEGESSPQPMARSAASGTGKEEE